MKNVVGGKVGGHSTSCVSCCDTPGPLNSSGLAMCMSTPAGMQCTDTYGTGTNGILCANLNTGETAYYGCSVQ
jgi:hypothetical protein